jgi:hypothetical protein
MPDQKSPEPALNLIAVERVKRKKVKLMKDSTLPRCLLLSLDPIDLLLESDPIGASLIMESS